MMRGMLVPHSMSSSPTRWAPQRSANEAVMTSDSTTGSQNAHAFFAHELRNLVNVATLSFEVLRATVAGVTEGNGRVLARSLLDLRTLIDQSLSDVRTAHSDIDRHDFLLADFINEMEAAATLEARVKGIRLVTLYVDPHLTVAGDRQALGAVVRNLLQNAFKFTKPGTTVILRVSADRERVLIEVEDQCGGLPDGCADDLFRPFEQRGQDRTGLGLGLAFSRKAVEACEGRISARSLHGRGCVFTVDLPRSVGASGRATGSTGLCTSEQRAVSRSVTIVETNESSQWQQTSSTAHPDREFFVV
jgi:signal transduction histidine kinase